MNFIGAYTFSGSRDLQSGSWVLGFGSWVLGLGSHETRHMKIRLDIGHTHMTGPGTQDQISVPNVDKSF